MADSDPIPRLTIGADVGDGATHLVALASDSGEILSEAKLATTREALVEWFAGRDRARVALEVGSQSRWIGELLRSLGHEVFVANPRQVRLIGQSVSKTDRADAERLAMLARVDTRLLHPVVHRREDMQRDLVVLRARDLLVRSRTRLVNHVRGTVKAAGGRLPSCAATYFARRAREGLPEQLAPALVPLLDQVEALTTQIRVYEQQVEQLSRERYPATLRLRQVPGVGPLTALAFVLTLEDPTRFKPARSVGPFLGLTPRNRMSGKIAPQLRITKAGDAYLRRLLVLGARHLLGSPHAPDTDLRRWGLRLAERGGKNARKRATVAVARKVAVLLVRLWASGEDYEPRRNSAPDSGEAKQ